MARYVPPPSTASPLGFGLSCRYCTCSLPFPDGPGGTIVYRDVVTVQPPLGLGTNPRTGAVLPSTTAGRPLVTDAIICRILTPPGGLPDVNIPTTVGGYGVSLDNVLNADLNETEAAMLSASIDAQAKQDERVTNSYTQTVVAGDMLIANITLNDGAGPFKLTLGIDTLAGDLQVLSAPT